MKSGNIYIIIPCYNEEKRLDFSDFKKYSDRYNFVFVNDGSSDGTEKMLNQHQNEFYILNLDKNVGKAEAIRQGVSYIQKQPDYNDVEWVGFWDADLATPLYEIENFLLYSKMFGYHADVIFGSRVLKLGSNIHRSNIRHLFGRAFITIVDNLLSLKCYDSQCGAKLFSKKVIEDVFTKPFISKWIFDVEILLRLSDYQVLEYPLKQWIDVEGSKVKIGRELLRTFMDIYKIKKNYKV